jgi:hypothetical protein
MASLEKQAISRRLPPSERLAAINLRLNAQQIRTASNCSNKHPNLSIWTTCKNLPPESDHLDHLEHLPKTSHFSRPSAGRRDGDMSS